jgi:hypothetical protein
VWALEFLHGQVPPENVGFLLADVANHNIAGLTPDEAGPAPVLTLTGGRYLGMTGTTGVYDLEAPEWVGGVPDWWMETRVFNLRALTNLCRTRLPDAAGSAA